jgi:hypothetical protein
MVVGKFNSPHPFNATHIVTRTKLPTHYSTQEVDQDVVIFGPAGSVKHDALEEIEAVYGPYVQTGLFQDFTAKGVLDSFAGFHQAARQ